MNNARLAFPLSSTCTFAGVFALLLVGCGGASLGIGNNQHPDDAGGLTGPCLDGQTQVCSCSDGGDGLSGLATCQDGEYGPCDCIELPDPVCGDDLCNGDEDCHSCVDDCGACPACDAAPTCTGADAVPLSFMSRGDLSVPMSGGAPTPVDASNCKVAQLKIRLAAITSTDEHDGCGFLGLSECPIQAYCVAQATDGTHSEVALTPMSSDIKENQSYNVPPSNGIFWGLMGLQPSRNNITIDYDCFMVEQPSIWASVLMAAGNAAGSLSGVAGAYGWAFGLGDVAAQAAAAAISAGNTGDKHLLNVEQTIPASELMDLTNGRTWSISKSGLRLTIQSWGCAEAKTRPPG